MYSWACTHSPVDHTGGRVEMAEMSALSPAISMRSGACSHVGLVRKLNEDSFATGEVCCIVADGMGGHDSGEVASAVSIDSLREMIGDNPPQATDLAAMIADVNDAVRSAADSTGKTGMGTTLVGVVIVRNGDDLSPVVFNVGDSRCYRLDDSGFVQVTIDHSHVEELVRTGQISPAEADQHPLRNVVTRALGPDAEVAADFFVLESRPARLLLCSDGLSGQIPFEQIGETLRGEHDPSTAAVALVEHALTGAAPDNITAVVVDIDVVGGGSGDETMPTDALAASALDITADRSLTVQQAVDSQPTATDGEHS